MWANPCVISIEQKYKQQGIKEFEKKQAMAKAANEEEEEADDDDEAEGEESGDEVGTFVLRARESFRATNSPCVTWKSAADPIQTPTVRGGRGPPTEASMNSLAFIWNACNTSAEVEPCSILIGTERRACPLPVFSQ